jgi:peptidyl-prolyl cis-trans isomerase B (cyclophilin B)
MRNNYILLMMMLFAISAILIGCNEGAENSNSNDIDTKETDLAYAEDVKENPIATITMDSGKEIKIELMPSIAPNTVLNFISLAQDGYYDGAIFHRVIPGFMIQGGDPTGTGRGGPGYTIDGEFTSNGFDNNLAHERGVISMARATDPNSAGSQFFIMVENSPHLDKNYASFGKVIEGIEVADEIVEVERDSANKPLQEQKIKSVTIDTKGFNYPKPNINK